MKKYDKFSAENLELWNKIKGIIDAWDPMDLVKCGAPSDEYNYEVSQIVTTKNSGATLDQLSTAVYEIFLKSFGPAVFKHDRQLFVARVKGLFSCLYE